MVRISSLLSISHCAGIDRAVKPSRIAAEMPRIVLPDGACESPCKISGWALFAVGLLQKIGMKVRLQLTDWGSVATPRQKKDSLAQGGQSISEKTCTVVWERRPTRLSTSNMALWAATAPACNSNTCVGEDTAPLTRDQRTSPVHRSKRLLSRQRRDQLEVVPFAF